MGNIFKLLSLIPYIVAGVEQIHGDAKTGAEKKQLALEALGFSANVAVNVDPTQKDAITAAYNLAANTIDGVQQVVAATKKPQSSNAG